MAVARSEQPVNTPTSSMVFLAPISLISILSSCASSGASPGTQRTATGDEQAKLTEEQLQRTEHVPLGEEAHALRLVQHHGCVQDVRHGPLLRRR